jgi:site-specific DNA-cytosine methylase
MRVLDLFCGCGGAAEGYRQAGLEVAVAIDNDPLALETHKANHPDARHIEADLENGVNFLDEFTPGEFDVVHGSPPCPDFSPANNARDPERGMLLIHAFEEIVEYLKPTWFIMENVRPVLKHIDGFYPVKKVLNAADFGVPQTRHRAFCGWFPAPLPTHDRLGPRWTLDGRRLERWVGAGEALDITGVIDTGRDWADGEVRHTDKPAPTFSAKSGQQWQLRSKHTVSGRQGTRATRSPDEPSLTVDTNPGGLVMWTGGGSVNSKRCRAHPRDLDQPSFTVTAGVPGRLIGGAAGVVRVPCRREGTLQEGVPGRLIEPAPTVTEDRYSPGSKPGNNARRAGSRFYRKLTPEECHILQGFPKEYIIRGGKTQRYRQIGNAVPPPVTRAIGKAIMEVGRLQMTGTNHATSVVEMGGSWLEPR